MCGSMVDIQSTAAEIRRGKERKKKDRNHRAKKYNGRINVKLNSLKHCVRSQIARRHRHVIWLLTQCFKLLCHVFLHLLLINVYVCDTSLKTSFSDR